MRRRDFLSALVTLPIAGRMVTTRDALTSKQSVTTYGNFYEFGSEKGDSVRNGGAFKATPWSVAVEGLCAKPGTYTLEDILKPHPIEERVYRMRCVEGWSMVIPWDGFPLGDLLIDPRQDTSKAGPDQRRESLPERAHAFLPNHPVSAENNRTATAASHSPCITK